jgi:chorismate mutase
MSISERSSDKMSELDRLQELIDRIDRQLAKRRYSWTGI